MLDTVFVSNSRSNAALSLLCTIGEGLMKLILSALDSFEAPAKNSADRDTRTHTTQSVNV